MTATHETMWSDCAICCTFAEMIDSHKDFPTQQRTLATMGSAVGHAFRFQRPRLTRPPANQAAWAMRSLDQIAPKAVTS
jgi:hypothetical protein